MSKTSTRELFIQSDLSVVYKLQNNSRRFIWQLVKIEEHTTISMSQQNHYQFNVVMSCSGCSNAINKVLSRLEPDVSKIETSLDSQTVDVYTTLPYETILEKIQKTGKEVKSGKQI